MEKEKLERFAEEIQKDSSKVYETTPRNLINAFGCSRRTPNCQLKIENFLKANNLEVEPNFVDVWIDATIVIKHKEKATTKSTDPIKRVKILGSANRPPVTINNDATLKEAVTKMILHNFSQLPVLSGPKNIIGYISWETIGKAGASNIHSEMVKEYVNKNIKILEPETPLMTAVRTIYDCDFVVIQEKDKTIKGIVTTSDISQQFLTMTEPFLLIEQIECLIRRLLDNKFLVEDLRMLYEGDPQKKISSIDDLAFGDYIKLIENNANWRKLGFSLDKAIFVEALHRIREARNDIVHFDPDGISESILIELRHMTQLLLTLLRN